MPLLNSAEKKAVLESWVEISKNLKIHGTKIFMQFFTAYPEYQKYFKSFAKVPLKQLSENKKLQAHGLTVMILISSLIDKMNEPELLDDMLLKIGANHIKHNLKRADINIFREGLIDYLSKELGSLWTKEAENGWKKLLTTLTSKIAEGVETTKMIHTDK